MNILPASAVRQDTFIIDTTHSETASESFFRQGNVVIPVIGDTSSEPFDSCSGSAKPNRLTLFNAKEAVSRNNRTPRYSRRALSSNKPRLYGDSSQEGETVLSSSRYADPDTDFSPILSSSTKEKLRQKERRSTITSVFRTEKTLLVNNVVKTLKSPNELQEDKKSVLGRSETDIAAHDTSNKFVENIISDLQEKSRKAQSGASKILNKQIAQAHIRGGSDITNNQTVKPLVQRSTFTLSPPEVIEIHDTGILVVDLTSDNKEFPENEVKKCKKISKNSISSTSPGQAVDALGSDSSPLVTAKMAKSNKSDYMNETFEDVLKERNEMLNTERVYRKRIRQLEEELKGMVIQCQVLSEENKELRKTVDSIKKTGDKSDNLDAAAKLKKLESEKTNLVAEYEAKLKAKDSILVENARVRSENAELVSKVRELEKQIGSLSHQKKSMDEADAKIKDLQAAVKDLQYENKALEAKVKSLEYDKNTLTRSLEDKRKELTELTQTLKEQTLTEEKLKDVKENFEKIEEENNRSKQELKDIKKVLRDLEKSKQRLQEQLDGRDSKQAEEISKKEKMIKDLRKDLDSSKEEIQKLEEAQKASNDAEKESIVLKSRIGSLKAEIDGSLAEKQKLKQDLEEMVQTVERLRQENSIAAEASRDSKKYLRNWEQEKEYRAKVEAELGKRREEVLTIQAALKDAENKVKILNNRIELLEDERVRLGNTSMGELESDNRALKDGNMKLRQMLVERNIELTNTKHEQTLADSRIRNLEQKQKKSEVRVQKLSQQLESVSHSPAQEERSTEAVKISSTRDKVSPNNRTTTTKSRPNNQHLSKYQGEKYKVAGQPLQTAYFSSQPGKNGAKHITRRSVSPGVGDSTRLHGDQRNIVTSSLPILEMESVISRHPRNGYFSLYQQKRIKQKGH